MIAKNLRLGSLLLTATLLLLMPLIAMQFTSEVDWSSSDFVIMGILLFGTALMCEFVFRKFKTTQQRIIFCFLILGAFFLIWAELAVGVFGTPFAGS